MTVLFFCLAASFVYGYWENNTTVRVVNTVNDKFWIEKNTANGTYRFCSPSNAGGNTKAVKFAVICDQWHRPNDMK